MVEFYTQAEPAKLLKSVILTHGSYFGVPASLFAANSQIQCVYPPRTEVAVRVPRGNIQYDHGKLINEIIALDANEEGFSLMKEVVNEWAYDAPQEADSWIKHSIPNLHLAGQLRAKLVSTWASRDPVGVAEYLATNETSPAMDDPALGAYALSLATAVPSEAEQWANLIIDNSTRLATLRAIRSVEPYKSENDMQREPLGRGPSTKL